MGESYVKDSHQELVNGYEKLMCSMGYAYKEFKTLHGRYKINHETYVAAKSKARNFNVYYKNDIIYCAIIITPDNDVFLTYKYHDTTEIRKILMSSSVKKFARTLAKYGNLNGF